MWQITTTFRNLSVTPFSENNGLDLNRDFPPPPKNVHGQRIIWKNSKKAKSANRVSPKETCKRLLTPGQRSEGRGGDTEGRALLVWLLLPSARLFW